MPHLHIGVFVELLEAILVHLNGRDILSLLHVDMPYVQPHVTEICRRFTNLKFQVIMAFSGYFYLGKNIPCLLDAALVGQNTADPIGCPDIPDKLNKSKFSPTPHLWSFLRTDLNMAMARSWYFFSFSLSLLGWCRVCSQTFPRAMWLGRRTTSNFKDGNFKSQDF